MDWKQSHRIKHVPSKEFERHRLLLQKIVKDCELVRIETHGNDPLETQSVMFVIPQRDILKIFQGTSIHAPTQATKVEVFFHSSLAKNGGRDTKIKISIYRPDTYRRLNAKEHRNLETATSIVERHWLRTETETSKEYSKTIVDTTGALECPSEKNETPTDIYALLNTKSRACPSWIYEIFIPCKEARNILIKRIRYHLGLANTIGTEIQFDNAWGHVFSTCSEAKCILFAYEWGKLLSAKAPVQWNSVFRTNQNLFKKWSIVPYR